MRGSLIASLLLHVALLVATFIVMPNPEAFKVEEQEMIPVDIVSVEDFSKRMAMTKAPEAPKKVETPRPKPQEVVKETKPAPEVAPEVKTAAKEPKSEPPPEPKKEEPKKEEAKKAEEPKPLDPDPLKDLIKDTVDDTPEPKKEDPKKEEVKKAEVTPEKKPDKKPEKKKPKKDLDVSSIENFLNKIDDKKTAPQKPTTETGQPQQSSVNLSGEDQLLAATLIDLFRQRISQCWSSPAGAREANMTIKIRLNLDVRGNVIGVPQILSAPSDTLSQTTAQSAISAIMDCQSYDFFPPDKYDLWKEITINFNPNMMT